MNILERLRKRVRSETTDPPARPAAISTPPAAEAREAKEGSGLSERRARNNYVVVILDSCRYDTLMEAAPRALSRLGAVERRWSYASWTAPSHYNLLMGLLPHSSPSHVYASEYYKRDFLKYNERLGAEDFEFKSLVPHLFLPTVLKRKLGIRRTRWCHCLFSTRRR